jgi:hypothetical protein
MRMYGAGSALLAATIALAGCSSFGKQKPAAPPVDPNLYPANYRNQIAGYLLTELKDRADFFNALISAPAIKPVQQSQHYVVCVQFNGHNEHRTKVLIYLGGALQEYLDPTPEQCGDAVYQPYPELAAEAPSK